MERLWTPWRLAYVTEAATTPTDGCILCAAQLPGEHASLVVHTGVRAFVILNKFPYNNGHLMIVPHRHASRLTELDADELLELMVLAQTAERALTEVYRPHAFNMGINLGRPAGAGIADHLHLHVVPRWNGDTSFITVFDDTRVLPEGLSATASRLRDAFAALAGAEAHAGADAGSSSRT
jgi:ATP adenylyltransferase